MLSLALTGIAVEAAAFVLAVLAIALVLHALNPDAIASAASAEADAMLSPTAAAIRKAYLARKAAQEGSGGMDDAPDDATEVVPGDSSTETSVARSVKHLVRKRKREFPDDATIRVRQV